MNKTANRLNVIVPPALLLLLFWSVSLYGLDFGVHWDETRAKFDAVKKSLDSGVFLQSVMEPDGYGYNYGGVNYLLTWSGFAPELTTFLLNGPRTREALSEALSPVIFGPAVRLRVRAIYVFLCSLSIAWLYCLCLAMNRSRAEALLAAAILSLSWEVAYHSRWVAPDVVMMQFVVLAFLCLGLGLKRRSLGWFYAAAIAAGLTAGTKYPGILALPFLLAGAAGAVFRERPIVTHAVKHVAAMTATAGLTFVLTTPGIVLDPFRFFLQLDEQREIYGFGWYGYTVQAGLVHLLEILKYFALQGLSHYWLISAVLALLGVLGLLALLKESRSITFLMVGFCLSYVAFFSMQKALLVRNILVLIPFLALVAARGATVLSQRLGLTGKRVFHAAIAVALIVNLGWEVYASGQIRRRGDLDYFLRRFAEYAQGSTGDTFFVSASLLASLSRLPDPLPANITAQPDDAYTRVAFLQSEGADVFWEKWPANRWDTYEKTFGALEVNLEAYPTFVGNERILVVNRERMERLPIAADYLAAPEFSASKTEVVAGKDFYILKVKNVSNSNVVLRFTFDGVVDPDFVQPLDEKGEARIDIASNVRKGSYRFLAYRKESDPNWRNVDVTVVVK